MADLTAKKSDALSAVVAAAPEAIAFAAKLAELSGFVTDNGFQTGGANAITDANCVGENAHLTAADFNAAVTALASLALSTPNRTALRKASRKPSAAL